MEHPKPDFESIRDKFKNGRLTEGLENLRKIGKQFNFKNDFINEIDVLISRIRENEREGLKKIVNSEEFRIESNKCRILAFQFLTEGEKHFYKKFNSKKSLIVSSIPHLLLITSLIPLYIVLKAEVCPDLKFLIASFNFLIIFIILNHLRLTLINSDVKLPNNQQLYIGILLSIYFLIFLQYISFLFPFDNNMKTENWGPDDSIINIISGMLGYAMSLLVLYKESSIINVFKVFIKSVILVLLISITLLEFFPENLVFFSALVSTMGLLLFVYLVFRFNEKKINKWVKIVLLVYALSHLLIPYFNGNDELMYIVLYYCMFAKIIFFLVATSIYKDNSEGNIQLLLFTQPKPKSTQKATSLFSKFFSSPF